MQLSQIFSCSLVTIKQVLRVFKREEIKSAVVADVNNLEGPFTDPRTTTQLVQTTAVVADVNNLEGPFTDPRTTTQLVQTITVGVSGTRLVTVSTTFSNNLVLPTIKSSASTATGQFLRSSDGSTNSFPKSSLSSLSSFTTFISFNAGSTTPISSFSGSAIPTFASTLSTSAKFGIGIGVFLGFTIMIIPSIFLWRNKRKNRIRKNNAAKIRNDQVAKAELDADQTQKPDDRARELPGDMAHELTGNREENEVLELPGDMAHELEDENDEYSRLQKIVRFSLKVKRKSFHSAHASEAHT